MNAITRTFTVRGHKLRTRTNRRFVVVAVRPEPVTTDAGTYVAFADIRKRTDNIDTARTVARRYGFPPGAFAVVVDLTTGEEI